MGRLLSKLRRVQARAASSVHRPPSGMRIVFVPPSYWLVDQLNADSVVVDMGLGNDADFSIAMIKRFDLTAHGFDPTRRHVPVLSALAEASGGHFIFRENAIGPAAGTATFHESQDNVSGSMIDDHCNVRRDAVEDYEVTVITLGEALEIAGANVDLVKMDIEGSEEAVLDACSDELLKSVPQWCVEFHHETVDGTTFADTRRYVNRFLGLGFKMYSRDSTNFLFYRGANAT